MIRIMGPGATKDHERRLKEGFYEQFLSGDNILDIGFRGGEPLSQPITAKAIGIELDYPGYDGRTLPFPDCSQDAVFSSHCLEHIQDYKEIISDWYRVLKIGGFLIAAVPHRDLYERKKFLPSRFNGDHRRMYTPATLLCEFEESLPVGGHRVRLLRDIDQGFDYTLPPEQHAKGSYEIELVIEKIAIPSYSSQLRCAVAQKDYVDFFSTKILNIIDSQRKNDLENCREILHVISNIPIPPIMTIRNSLHNISLRPWTENFESEFRNAMLEIAKICQFDADFYRDSYNDLSGLDDLALRSHFLLHGYLEGRKCRADDKLFD